MSAGAVTTPFSPGSRAVRTDRTRRAAIEVRTGPPDQSRATPGAAGIRHLEAMMPVCIDASGRHLRWSLSRKAHTTQDTEDPDESRNTVNSAPHSARSCAYRRQLLAATPCLLLGVLSLRMLLCQG